MLKCYQILVLASPLPGHLIDQELGVCANSIRSTSDVKSSNGTRLFTAAADPGTRNVVAADQRLVQAGNIFVLLIECDEGTGRWARLGG